MCGWSQEFLWDLMEQPLTDNNLVVLCYRRESWGEGMCGWSQEFLWDIMERLTLIVIWWYSVLEE